MPVSAMATELAKMLTDLKAAKPLDTSALTGAQKTAGGSDQTIGGLTLGDALKNLFAPPVATTAAADATTPAAATTDAYTVPTLAAPYKAPVLAPNVYAGGADDLGADY